jgi:hypothetical protein
MFIGEVKENLVTTGKVPGQNVCRCMCVKDKKVFRHVLIEKEDNCFRAVHRMMM